MTAAIKKKKKKKKKEEDVPKTVIKSSVNNKSPKRRGSTEDYEPIIIRFYVEKLLPFQPAKVASLLRLIEDGVSMLSLPRFSAAITFFVGIEGEVSFPR
ncbi:hypothetical protein Trydic_g9315 [Trypoxylus dichotomus]